MKIQKLIINAFGPYALRQELDFEKNLQDKNMFVITGNTGAGKTTIFDAINFALYGEPSGSDRDGKSLRSDFADPQTPTEVELWFSLRGKEYYVKRTPTYLRPKQRGEGFIENKAAAEIKLSKDKTITGIKEVTKEIESILGITTEQFKQLVMIPQGEFKKLLNARSDEKEDIFRKIFGTEIFASIQKQMKEQANKLKRSVEQVERDRFNKIRSFICEEKDEELFRLINANDLNIELLMGRFYEFIEGDNKEQKKLEEKIKEISTIISKISKEITLGEANNKKFDNMENTKEELAKLKVQVGGFENKRIQVNRGKKALTVRSYEEKYNEKYNKSKSLDLEIKEIEKKIEVYKESYEKSEQQFKNQQCREEGKNQLIKSIDENLRLKDKVAGYEINKINVENLEKIVKEIKARIEKIGLTTKDNDKKMELINNQLEEIKKARKEKGTFEIKLLNCMSKNDKLKKLSSTIEQWIENNETYIKAGKNFEKFEENFKIARKNYEYLDDTIRRNQAGLLALNLQEGIPCPVCGAIHHPRLAQLKNSEITEEVRKYSKESLEKAREEKDKQLNELTNMYTSLKTIKENSIKPALKDLLKKDDVEDINKAGIEVNEVIKNNEELILKLKTEISSLDNIISNEDEKIKYGENIQKSNEALRKELQLKNDELVVKERELSAANNTLENIKNEFKGEIKTVRELEKIEEVLSEKLQCLKKAYEDTEKAFNISKSKLDQEMGRQKTTNQMKEKASEELKEAIRIFKDSVLALGFKGYEDYKASSLTEEKIESIDKEVTNFNLKLAGTEKLYEASLKEIQGLSRVDLQILKEKLENEKKSNEDLNNERMSVFSRVRNNKLVLEDCKKYNKEIEDDEKKYEIVGKLSNIINGDNLKKISFERYVLAAYFEDIIEAANIRFNKMTSGRFELLRKVDIGDKRKGQGLDLEVFDNYTGKARDVKTLSGGESFKASLAMALGLADVVQAYAGGIQLDTMFIDEGFGTLDPESLDNAIECLMDLQNDGRIVGVISHVPELKERIPARLEVSSTNKGSKAEFKV